MCACVGDDDFGKLAVESLKKDGIDTRFIRTVDDTPTGTAVIIVVDGDNRIVLDKGANACLSGTDVDNALAEAKKGDILLTQLENPIEIIGYALQKGKEKGMKVVLNPAPADVKAERYLSSCDLVVPNETETKILGGRDNILTKTGGSLIVTLGKQGFEITRNFKSKAYSCIEINAVDTTAAGDTFCGGLVAKLAAGENLENSAKFGSLAASVACTKRGAQPSIPTKSEVENYKI